MKRSMACSCLLALCAALWSQGVCAEGLVDSKAVASEAQRIELGVGKSKVVDLTTSIKRASLANPEVADTVVLSPKQIYLTGKAIGVTTLTLWKENGELFSAFDVRVTPDLSQLREQLHMMLPDEPGILVTHAERMEGRYFFKGLRDPLSRDPVEVLQDAGMDPRNVTWQGEPFLSLHPQFAAIRGFEQQRAEIERRTIHFDLGSAAFSPGQIDEVNELSAVARSLFSAAAAAGKAVRLDVIGHADTLGTREANAKLSRDRASNVVRLLASQGVAPDRLLAQSEVPADAPAQTAAEGAELERCVSFRVVAVSR